MDHLCPYIEQDAFSSMGDLSRATKVFRTQPKSPEALEKINAYRYFRLNCIQTSLSLLSKASPPERVLISARLKRIRSILRKIRRGQQGSINEMDDIIGFRIICRSYAEANAMSSRIRDVLDARIKNYLETDHKKDIGYRAQHGIVRFRQPFGERTVTVRFEIQIRTWYQHLWACWCESHGEHAKEGFHSTTLPTEETQKLKSELQACSRAIADWEQTNPDIVQRKNDLPVFSDPYSVALAWFNSNKKFDFDQFGRNASAAVRELNRLEFQDDIDPLLLVGVGEPSRIRGILQENTSAIHERWISGSAILDAKIGSRLLSSENPSLQLIWRYGYQISSAIRPETRFQSTCGVRWHQDSLIALFSMLSGSSMAVKTWLAS